MTDSKSDKIAIKIFNEENECSFTAGNKAVCSPKSVVGKMKEFAKTKGKNVSGDQNIVKTVKDLLNCNSESCILKRADFVQFAKLNNIEAVLNNFFKPEGPALDFGLLSNFNIDDVLDQLVIRFKHKKFLHIPFQMRDFAKVGTSLATINLANEFRNGTKTFGVVLNTDYSTGGGIHWFCLFGEDHGSYLELEYFNSSGKAPLPEVQAWLQKQKHFLAKELKKEVRVWYSTGIRFQDDDHSCGVYCLCYIWLRLEGITPRWFKSNNFNDSLMHKVRKNLFRHEK